MPKKNSAPEPDQIPAADVEGEGRPVTKVLLPPEYLDDMSAAAFSERLKRTRQGNGLTLDALSLVTKGVDPEGKGISRVSLSRYETGTSPGLRELRLLSLALRRTLAWLVYGDDEDPMSPAASVMAFEDLISQVVLDVLAAKGLAEREPSPRYHPAYTQLLEEAKKLCK